MNNKLKVGLFIDTFFPMVDGVVMVVDNYARRLSKFCDVTVFAPVGRKKFDDSSLPYKVVRCTKRFKLAFLDYDLPMPKSDKNFKKELKNANLDVIHIHSPFTIGKMALSYAKKNNIPTIMTMHSQFKKDFKRAVKFNCLTNIMVNAIMKRFNSADECWAVNGAIAKIFVDYGAKTLPKVQQNGTDLVYFDNNDEIEKLKQKYNIQKDEKVFLFIGRLTKLKNIFFIADALKILKDNGIKFKMIYVGTGTDQEQLKKHIDKLGIQENVIFTGKITSRDEIAKHYKMADLFLFPSMYDASSLVQIEAASQKTPTLFLRGAATADTITENINGYVAENSVDAFAKKIEEIFSNPKEYKKISENAYKDLYVTWDKVVEKVYKDYLQLILEKKEQK